MSGSLLRVQDLSQTNPMVEIKFPVETCAAQRIRNPYLYKTTITFGDTDCFRSVYFLNYLKIAGVVRELWVRDCVPNFGQHLEKGLLLITRNVSCDFIKPLFVFDVIRCEMTVERLRITSAELVFHFYKDSTNELHAMGRHKIVLADQNQKLCPMPKDFHEAAKNIQWEEVVPAARKTLSRTSITPFPRP
jgi:acyl-CoA thioesterase FadM